MYLVRCGSNLLAESEVETMPPINFRPSIIHILSRMSFSNLPRSLLFLSIGIALGVSATCIFIPQSPQPSSPSNDSTTQDTDIVDGVDGLIGNTKLVRIRSLSKATGCEILAKAEVPFPLTANKFLNPGGSPKDRVALAILNSLGGSNSTNVFEGTSGSTGISLAMLCSAMGLKSHILLPEDIALEKIELLDKLGAIVERVKPASIVDKAQFVNAARRRAQLAGGIFTDQFENEENWKCHATTTGPEIYKQCGGKLDAFVSGAGISTRKVDGRYWGNHFGDIRIFATAVAGIVGRSCGSSGEWVV
jgi:cysteine synthase